MIGLPEILILAVLVLLVIGYKKLPQLGRSAGKGLRSAGESAKELSTTVGDKVGEKVGDKFDPSEIGKSAGRGLREAREFKDALTSMPEAGSKKEPPAKADGAEGTPAPESTASDENAKSSRPAADQP